MSRLRPNCSPRGNGRQPYDVWPLMPVRSKRSALQMLLCRQCLRSSFFGHSSKPDNVEISEPSGLACEVCFFDPRPRCSYSDFPTRKNTFLTTHQFRFCNDLNSQGRPVRYAYFADDSSSEQTKGIAHKDFWLATGRGASQVVGFVENSTGTLPAGHRTIRRFNMPSSCDQGGRPITPCPKCRTGVVQAVAVAADFVYLRCRACQFLSVIENRRTGVRSGHQGRILPRNLPRLLPWR